jgi:serine protease inhibitor
MYLLAPWAEPFERMNTRAQTFHLSATARVQVPTMQRTDTMRFAQGRGFKIVELAYAGDELAMDVFVPDAVDGVGALEAELTVANIQASLASLAPTRVALSLPTFRVAGETLPLRPSLEALGMRLPFDREQADFTGIANPPVPSQRLHVSNAYHKVYVDVTERGTEAAAATAIVMAFGGMGMPQPSTAVTVDRPFVFMIRDTRTGAILFIGRVVDPRARG